MAEPLYLRASRSRKGAEPAPEDAILAVHAFLERCRDFARDRELPSRIERIRTDPTPEHVAKLHQWTSWIAFVEHAVREIEDGRLDSWFTPDTEEHREP